MAKLKQDNLPDCWIFDRAILKWQRKTFVIVGVMDLQSRKLLAADVLHPLDPQKVANLLTTAVTKFGNPPALVVGIDKVFQTPLAKAAYEAAEVQPVDLRHGKVSVSIFIRSLWRSLEWEAIHCRQPAPSEESFRQLILDWVTYYNVERFHQALGYDKPDRRWATLHGEI